MKLNSSEKPPSLSVTTVTLSCFHKVGISRSTAGAMHESDEMVTMWAGEVAPPNAQNRGTKPSTTE
jgi:hypothetical protein